MIETSPPADNVLLVLTINHTLSTPTVEWGTAQSLYGKRVSIVYRIPINKIAIAIGTLICPGHVINKD